MAIDLSENGQAPDALRETGPGQHFLGRPILRLIEDAFRRSQMADNTTFEQWSSEGAVDSIVGPVTGAEMLAAIARQWIRQLTKAACLY